MGEGQEGLRKLSSSSWCDEELDAGGIPPWDSHPSLPRIFPIPEAGLWFTRHYLALLWKMIPLSADPAFVFLSRTCSAVIT